MESSIDKLRYQLQQRLPGAQLVKTQLPLVPEINLWLLENSFDHQGLPPEIVEVLMDSPPYWVFCWASGQVLARYLLDNADIVAGKVVVDLGPGSGVVAIAAALAGAERVIACDLDSDALQAVTANAVLNGVVIELSASLEGVLPTAQLVTVADVLYDRENLPLLAEIARCPWVLLADSRIKNFSEPGYQLIGKFQATTWPDLSESVEFNQVRLYQSQQDR